MNTANLQLQGSLIAFFSFLETMPGKGLLTGQEIATTLDQAEKSVSGDHHRPDGLSVAQWEAIRFTLRFLKLSSLNPGSDHFAQVAARVGTSKDPT
jgi:hypothetical protein